jgi:O-antigen polymerase
MTRTLTRATSIFQVAILATLFSTVFLANTGFFNGLITSKQWGLEHVAVVSALFLVVSLPFIRTIRVTIIDLFVLLFIGWYILNDTIFQGSPFRSVGHLLFQCSLWLVVYLFVRVAAHKSEFLWGVAIVWMLVVLLQSGLGLMQLYGFERSYHGLFSITGTFHNPGPFSGFVVSGLPLVLGFVCYTNSYTEVHGDSTEAKRRDVEAKRNSDSSICFLRNPLKRKNRGIFLKRLNVKIPFITIFRYSILALAWITLIAILLVLPPAQSRAAWIAGIAGCLFVLAGHPMLLTFKENLRNKFLSLRKPIRILLLTAILLPLATAAFGLYTLKPGSADGRMLMWQVTSQLIKQSPITGHGTDAFNALYMNEQANWFASGKGTQSQAMVAGSPEAPFNEFLKLWLEKGLIAILLAGAILYFIFFAKSKTSNLELRTSNLEHQTLNPHPALRVPILGIPLRYNYRCAALRLQTINYQTQNPEPQTINHQLPTHFSGALLSLLTFSLFSYPFNISSFILQLVILVALLSGTSSTVMNITGSKALFLTIPLAFAIILGAVHFIPQRQAHYLAMKTWQQADQLYNYRAYPASVEAYAEAYPALQTNGLFLQMYGKALSMDEQHHKSNEILALAQQRFSSQIIQNTLGDNHKALGNYPEAEVAYTKSAQMIPSLLLPKYLLAKLYNDSGQHHKAQQTATEILNSPVKVESSATREIMNEMRSVINEQSSVINDQ